jgi:hypothetical protein
MPPARTRPSAAAATAAAGGAASSSAEDAAADVLSSLSLDGSPARAPRPASPCADLASPRTPAPGAASPAGAASGRRDAAAAEENEDEDAGAFVLRLKPDDGGEDLSWFSAKLISGAQQFDVEARSA